MADHRSDFKVDIQHGNQATFQVHQPQALGKFSGSAAGNVPKDSFHGDVDIDTSQARAASDGTVFALELLLGTALEMKVFQYESAMEDASASLNARIPHTFRIATAGSGGLAVTDGDQQAHADVTMNGGIADWAETDTFALGDTPRAQTIHTDSSKPPKRDAPEESGFAIFGDKRYIQCSKSESANLTCPPLSDLGDIDPELNGPGEEGDQRKRNNLESLVRLEKRTGTRRNFRVRVAGNDIVTIRSHPYWTGGEELLQHNPNAGYYDLNNEDCVDRTWNSDAAVPAGVTPVAEHVLELQTHPRFLEFIMGAPADLLNGHTRQTEHPTIDTRVFETGGRYTESWSAWDPQGQTHTEDDTPADDIWRAYGDTHNDQHMINAEPHFNNLKMQIFRGNDPISDRAWGRRNFEDTANTDNALSAIGAMRDVIGTIDYMNEDGAHTSWTTAANDVRSALAHFQDRFNQNVPQGMNQIANLPEMWDEYIRQVLIPQIQNNVRTWVGYRIDELRSTWSDEREGATGQRQEVINGILEALEDLWQGVVVSLIKQDDLT